VDFVDHFLRTTAFTFSYLPLITIYSPLVENALKQNITVHNVNQKKEHLVVYCTLTYNSKGSQLQMGESTTVRENNSEKVDIKI